MKNETFHGKRAVLSITDPLTGQTRELELWYSLATFRIQTASLNLDVYAADHPYQNVQDDEDDTDLNSRPLNRLYPSLDPSIGKIGRTNLNDLTLDAAGNVTAVDQNGNVTSLTLGPSASYIPAAVHTTVPTYVHSPATPSYKEPNVVDGRMTEDYAVGDIVTNRFEMNSHRYRVLKMRPSTKTISGGYEVYLGLLDPNSSEQDTYAGAWYFASDFWPDFAYKQDLATKAAKALDHYPHKCPYCGGPSFNGFTSLDCKSKCQALKR